VPLPQQPHCILVLVSRDPSLCLNCWYLPSCYVRCGCRVINACSGVCLCVFQKEPEMQTTRTWKAASASLVKAETVSGAGWLVSAGSLGTSHVCSKRPGTMRPTIFQPQTLGRLRCRAAKPPNLPLGGAIAGLRKWQLCTRVQHCKFDALYSRHKPQGFEDRK
jgi:hypothetical protein